MTEKNRTKILLLLIVVLGAFLRFYRLVEVPPSLFGDEVDVGYQAYSIFKTGRDYSGNFLPIHFQSLADWRTPLFLYATVPFVWLFGLTELGVRFLPALMGVLTIPAMYLLVSEFSRMRITRMNPNSLSLLSALLLAISPWHLQYSRAAFEVTLMLFLVILGVWGFLRGLRNRSAWCLVLSAWCLALAPYSYNTAKLFVPLFVGLLVFCFWKSVKRVEKGKMGVAILVFVLVSLPMAKDIFFGQGGSRFGVLSIFTDPTVVPKIGFERLIDAGIRLEEVTGNLSPSLTSRLLHNKFLSWGTTFVINYFRVFSTEFLFTFGDTNFRHSIQGNFGQFFWLDALFLVFGVFLVFRGIGGKGEKREKLFLLGWLLLAPISSALTRDGGNHATRLILMLPPLLILVSLGILGFLGGFGEKGKRGKKVLAALVVIGYSLLVILYLHRYYVHWPLESEEWWHYGYKQLADYVKQNQDQYDYIVWSDRDQPPLIFSLFWLGLDPRIYQEGELKWTQVSDAIWADHLVGTKHYFGHVAEERIKANGFIGTLKPNILYIIPEVEIGKDFRREPVPESIRLLETIYYPSSRIAKYILTGK